MARMFYGKQYPEFARTFANSDYSYNEQCDEIDELKTQGRVCVLAPSQKVEVERLEPSMEKLGNLYYLGYNDTMARMDEIKAYLAK